jgi:hypothetical protein
MYVYQASQAHTYLPQWSPTRASPAQPSSIFSSSQSQKTSYRPRDSNSNKQRCQGSRPHCGEGHTVSLVTISDHQMMMVHNLAMQSVSLTTRSTHSPASCRCTSHVPSIGRVPGPIQYTCTYASQYSPPVQGELLIQSVRTFSASSRACLRRTASPS